MSAVTASGITADMSKALRVAVVMDSKSVIYAPAGTSGVTDIDSGTEGFQYKVYSGHAGEGEAATATEAGTVTVFEANTEKLLAADESTEIPAKGESNNGGVDVAIYIYFEGEDTILFSQNFKADTLTVTVDFTANISSAVDGGGA